MAVHNLDGGQTAEQVVNVQYPWIAVARVQEQDFVLHRTQARIRCHPGYANLTRVTLLLLCTGRHMGTLSGNGHIVIVQNHNFRCPMR